MSIADLRRDYSQATLSEHEVDSDPITQFGHWFQETLSAELPEPNAMSLATVGSNGKPSLRIVLLKDFDARGFTWYTNYQSRKGEDLLQNPHAAESDAYFKIRPIKSQLGAIASMQSKPIDSRESLEKKFDEAGAKFGDNPPRPAHWGGYRLTPEWMEFWQGRRSRLHDRVVYTRGEDGHWTLQRLQP
jgi:pyridoxamine 5'-phosphate oxidase